jgi:predicted GNAT family acetyltransferase
MANIPEEITVTDNRAAGRYQTEINGFVALADYELEPDRIIFTHTEVPEALSGGGVGGKLARFALDDARARNLAVIPLCPFIAAYIRRHPEYLDLVPPAQRHRVQGEA